MNMPTFPLTCLEGAKTHLLELIENNRVELDKLLNQPDITYLNFIRPFMDGEERISVYFTPISHLQSVKNSPESREAFAESIEPLVAYNTELIHNKELYNAYVQIKNNEYEKLDYCKQKILDDAIFLFELEGVTLSEHEKNRLSTINVELSKLADDFSQNVLNATNSYEIIVTDEAELGDMPQSDKNSAKCEAGWKFNLQMPSYVAFMTYVTNREKREQVYKAYSTRAPENDLLIGKILALRQEKATILGYTNYADLNLKTMSAPSATAVIDFLKKLTIAGKPFAEKELNELKSFAELDGVKDLGMYDLSFYSEKLKKKLYNYDEEELRPYFEQKQVVTGMFNLLYELFEMEFIKKDVKLWDDKASFYELYIQGELFGGLYLDLEARSDKRSGAWMNDWHTRYIDAKGKLHLPDVFVVCNFPQSTDIVPSLLRHNDVTTFFHEMGHAIHHLMSRVSERNLSGVNGIDWDTVEFPSQFLENFAYSSLVLKKIGRHHITHEELPDELIQKITDSRNFQAGMALVRQLEFGLFDMLIHTSLKNPEEVQDVLNAVRKEVSVILPPAYNKFQYSFSHIFAGGYAAGYYSYKWAEMLSSDAYCEFMRKGVLNRELARRYKDTVLALGASKKMSEIYDEFLGRQPEPEAILELAGLL